MKVSKNRIITLIYELRFDDRKGEIIEIIEKDSPLEFVFGSDELLESFEEKIHGMNPGNPFEFILKADEAYGEFFEDAVVEMSKDVFKIDDRIDEEMLYEGNELPMKDAEGNEYNGIIVEVKEDTVVVDFNHPLAGENLYFKGEILEVRPL